MFELKQMEAIDSDEFKGNSFFFHLSAREQCTHQLNLNGIIACCYLNRLLKIFFYFPFEVIISIETATRLAKGQEKCSLLNLLTDGGKQRTHPRIAFQFLPIPLLFSHR